MDVSSDSDDDLLAIIAVLHHIRKRKVKHQQRRWWIRPWLSRRQTLGAYQCLLQELRREDIDEYTKFLRMEPQHFDFLLEAVRGHIQKEDTFMRRSIGAGERLAVTLRFLASGDSFSSLSYLYRISRQALGQIIPETCEAIYKALSEKYMKAPDTEKEWQILSDDFEQRWAFPNCIGALDGKHIALKAPNNSGSLYFNYKGFHSIVLLAVIDAHYRFILYDLGVNGRHGDAGIFGSSDITVGMQRNVPPPKKPRDWDTALPHVIVGDEAFPLKPGLMKPYPFRGLTIEQRVFNFRLSHARLVAENAFGIIVNRFACLATRMCLQPATAVSIVRACMVLHNFLRTECDVRYAQETRRTRPCQWYGELDSQGPNRTGLDAREVRNSFRDYFTSAGAVDWQWDRC